MKYLVGFLLDRIEEDQAAASAALEAVTGPADADSDLWVWAYIGAGSSRYAGGVPPPQRVLAECEAKRQVVALTLERLPGVIEGRATVEAAGEIRWLAAPYSHHPEYRPDWSP